MWIRSTIALLVCQLTVQQAFAQEVQANAQIIAQANDRCMATYAVRLTKTDATDEAIYAEAARSCQPLQDNLATALKAQLTPAQADDILKTLAEQAKPNFMAMLTQIRSDRATRASN